MKLKTVFHLPRILALMALLTLVVFSASSQGSSAQTVTEGFSSDETLQRGMIVTLNNPENQDDLKKISAATKETAHETYGVVVSANDSPVTLSEEGQQYFVATVGHFDVLVSNQSGNISKGDYITISSVPGIGMKAGDKDPIAVGKALADFNPDTDIISNITLKDTKGEDFQASVSRLQVQINVAKNPLLRSTEPELPDALKKITDSVAGKQTSALKAYVALAIVIMSAGAAGTIIYGGVKSAIISVGRNPLSKRSIVKSMVKVIVSGLIIFISGLFGVYLILRL